ncbi:MAG: hypothetical protein M1608_04780 [Candidatus Omnitrophica bacterium]|nr:hypothetical protein [Candidatus Omnitrophota bacterium]
MKKIRKDDLYRHLTGYLKNKGIEFTDGTYAQRVRQGCEILAEVINFANQTVTKAKTEMDTRLDRMRQIIHDKTAPKQGAPPKSQARKTSTRKKAAKRPTNQTSA